MEPHEGISALTKRCRDQSVLWAVGDPQKAAVRSREARPDRTQVAGFSAWASQASGL